MGLLAKNGLRLAYYGLERNPGFVCFFVWVLFLQQVWLGCQGFLELLGSINLSASASRGLQLEAGSITPDFKVCLVFLNSFTWIKLKE